MKKNIYKILATAFAMALMVASPATAITSHAYGFNANSPEDTTDYGMRPSGGGSSDSGSSDSGSSSSSYDSSSHSSESSDSGSSHSDDSYDSGSSYGGGHGFNANSPEDTTNYGVRPSTNSANDVTVNVTGGQKFRSVMNADHTVYQVYHCGISRATFVVADDKGNTVAFKNVALEQGEDNLWYLNIKFADGVDTKGYVVGVTKGDATYLKTELGVSGLKINGTVVLSTVPETDEK